MSYAKLLHLWLYLSSFRDDNYDGASLCLYPSDTSNCYPSFFLQKDIGWIADQISSVRRGCHSQNILQTIQPPPETEELETGGYSTNEPIMVPHKNEPLLNSGLKKHAKYVHILMILSSVIQAFSWKIDMWWLRSSNLKCQKSLPWPKNTL